MEFHSEYPNFRLTRVALSQGLGLSGNMIPKKWLYHHFPSLNWSFSGDLPLSNRQTHPRLDISFSGSEISHFLDIYIYIYPHISHRQVHQHPLPEPPTARSTAPSASVARSWPAALGAGRWRRGPPQRRTPDGARGCLPKTMVNDG